MEFCLNLDETAWGQLLPSDAAALQQSWHYGQAVAALGGEVRRGLIVGNDKPLALVQLLRRRFGPVAVNLASRGPIWLQDMDLGLKRLGLATLKKAMGGAVLITPDLPLNGTLPLYTSVSMAELDLTPDLDALRRGMHGKWRNALRGAEKAGLTLKVTRNPDVLAALVERDQSQQRARGYRNLPPKFLAAWVRGAPTAFRVYRAMMGGDAVAEALFLDHAPGVTYQIGWTSGAGRAFSAQHLLIWQAMVDFARLGRLRLDLGVVDTVTAPGLARFKLGTGAGVRVLGETGLILPRLGGWARAAA